MVGVADRVRRPAGSPLTRRPRLGQWAARKTALLPGLHSGRACLIMHPAAWPAVRRAGLPRQSAALTAGAAPQAPP